MKYKVKAHIKFADKPNTRLFIYIDEKNGIKYKMTATRTINTNEVREMQYERLCKILYDKTPWVVDNNKLTEEEMKRVRSTAFIYEI